MISARSLVTQPEGKLSMAASGSLRREGVAGGHTCRHAWCARRVVCGLSFVAVAIFAPSADERKTGLRCGTCRGRDPPDRFR